MNFNLRLAILGCTLAAGTTLASASGVTFTCDASINTVSGTPTLCSSINSIVGGDYASIFSNANASIYIRFNSSTGLGDSTSGYFNEVSYATCLAALTSTASHDTVDTDALLTISNPGANIELTSALAESLGITHADQGNGVLNGIAGTTPDGSICYTPGVGNCYNGIIQIVTPAGLSLETGGTQFLSYTYGSTPSDAYDIFSVIEHETDELFGTGSCVSADTASNGCPEGAYGAVDLFRYDANGNKVFASATPGAYFSYNNGAVDSSTYNTLPGGDYADFSTNCKNVQDATACLGGNLDLTNDGGTEIKILDAIGLNLNTAVGTPVSATPEPGTLTLLGSGMAAVAAMVRRRRLTVV